MHYFYVEKPIKDTAIKLSKDESHHCANVLRLKLDSEIKLVDGIGNIYNAKIANIHKKNVVCEITGKKKFPRRALILNLFVPLIKTNLFELILAKATEIGIENIFPLICEREKPHSYANKKKRFEKKILEAFKVSRRYYKPELKEPVNIKEIFNINNGLNLIFHNYSNTKLTKSLIKNHINNRKVINLIIGPEGGFSEEEVSFFSSNSALILKLSEFNLRVETAAIYAVVLLNYWFN
jgi:16S rRNA (uracil1498-N3)-methyltransferase